MPLKKRIKNGKVRDSRCRFETTPTHTPITRGQGLKTKFSAVVRHGGGLGPRPRRLSPSGFFLYFFDWDWSGPVPPPPIEWTSFPPLVTAALITPEGAESPGSRRIGAIGALVYFRPSETVMTKRPRGVH